MRLNSITSKQGDFGWNSVVTIARDQLFGAKLNN